MLNAANVSASPRIHFIFLSLNATNLPSCQQTQAIHSPDLAYFSYLQFCQLIGQETMRRLIPNIELIERIAYDQISKTDQDSPSSPTDSPAEDDEDLEESSKSAQGMETPKKGPVYQDPDFQGGVVINWDNSPSNAALGSPQIGTRGPKLNFPGNNQFWKTKVQSTHEDKGYCCSFVPKLPRLLNPFPFSPLQATG